MGKTVVSFVAVNEEARVLLDMHAIRYTSTPSGVEVMFESDVQITSDQGAYSQPSYYCYQVGKDRFVYPLDTQTLAVE